MVMEMEMSKTYQYRKVMKPMLERKRRARINKCLDDLKDLMVECLKQEGEHVTRLEKADILELTVEHMKKLKQRGSLSVKYPSKSDCFRSGFFHAADQVSKVLAATPGVDVDLGTKLMTYLGNRLNQICHKEIQQIQQSPEALPSIPYERNSISPSWSDSSDCHSHQAYLKQGYPYPQPAHSKVTTEVTSANDIWRPW